MSKFMTPSSILTVLLTSISVILLWVQYNNTKEVSYLTPAILATGMFIVPGISVYLRKSEDVCTFTMGNILFIGYGISVLASIAFVVGYNHEKLPERGVVALCLYALASVAGHYMGWEERSTVWTRNYWSDRGDSQGENFRYYQFTNEVWSVVTILTAIVMCFVEGFEIKNGVGFSAPCCLWFFVAVAKGVQLWRFEDQFGSEDENSYASVYGKKNDELDAFLSGINILFNVWVLGEYYYYWGRDARGTTGSDDLYKNIQNLEGNIAGAIVATLVAVIQHLNRPSLWHFD